MSEQQTLPTIVPDAAQRRALLEAIVYVAEDPLTIEQIASGLDLDPEVIQTDLAAMIEESGSPARGVEIRMVARGYKMFTKPEHHEAVRQFVKTLRPKLKLSLAALETLAVIAYKQPVTVPEVQAIRGVNAGGVIHTLLNRKLIAAAGRKKVIGKPMLYKTTREFLMQFGLSDVGELPSLKELEELSRSVLGDELEADEAAPADEQPPEDAAAGDQAEQAADVGGRDAAEVAAAPAEATPPEEAPAGDQAEQSADGGEEDAAEREAAGEAQPPAEQAAAPAEEQARHPSGESPAAAAAADEDERPAQAEELES